MTFLLFLMLRLLLRSTDFLLWLVPVGTICGGMTWLTASVTDYLSAVAKTIVVQIAIAIDICIRVVTLGLSLLVSLLYLYLSQVAVLLHCYLHLLKPGALHHAQLLVDRRHFL